MYLFFDRQGTLLEIVNDVAMRQYNTNVNKIYVHIQDDTRPTSGKVPENIAGINHRYLSHGAKEPVDGKPVVKPANPGQYNESFKCDTVPYNRDRDLKHFVYGRRYEFFVLDIPSGVYEMTACEQAGCECVGLTQDGDVFNLSGTVLSTIQIVYNDKSCLTLEKVAFTVEDAVIMPEKTVTGSQFAWLLSEFLLTEKKISGFDNYNNLKNVPIINADLSSIELVADTYYKHTGEDGTYKTGVIYYYNGTKLIAIDGGTSLTLNGEETDNAAIYAPTKGGVNSGVQVLVPHGDGKEPTWEELSIVEDGLKHTIKLGKTTVGEITLPQDTYIDSVDYDSSNHIVTLKYNGESGRKDKTIDLSDLFDTAGAGLQKSGNVFSVKTYGSYLNATTNGLSVAAQSIADLAKIKLNNSSQTAKSTTFYAPTSAGSRGQLLFSNGSGAPTWDNFKVNNETVKGKSIYAPTSSRQTNTTNSCYVLVPNGVYGAPIWNKLEVSYSENDLVYTLKLGDVEFGKIELTQEIYLESVTYNAETNKLIFTYNTASGKSQIEVDLTDLVDMYEAGNGLVREGGIFSIKIAPDSEKYLKSTAEGLVFDESALPTGLPEVTPADSGKFLRVDANGKWVAQSIPSAEEASF